MSLPQTPADAFEVHIEAGVGLSALITRGADAATSGGDPLGVLALELGSERGPAVSIEVFFAHGGLLRQIERLDVRLHHVVDSRPSDELTLAVLETFGGTAFTNLVLARADGHEICDLSVSVAPPLRLLVQNTLLSSDALAPEEIVACRETFERLGIESRGGDGLVVPAHQLRRSPTLTQQVLTFGAACERFAHVELFASPLPPAQSARLAFLSAERGGELDLTLTRSNLERSSLAKRACDEMQALITQRFGFGFDDTTWRGQNFHAERQPFEAQGVLPDRSERRWSLNWNARSR
jgi:hypothetical protein